MSRQLISSGWRYARCGSISSVLKLESFELSPQKGEAIVEMLRSPLHRSDASVINGTALGHQKTSLTYSLLGSFPRIGGVEGVGRVVRSSGEGKVKEGDAVWVAPPHGTWASHIAVKEEYLHTIDPKHTSLATTASNFLMAFHLLHGYRPLKAGDVVLQNGGSSITSLAVSALATKLLKDITVFTVASPGNRFAGAKERHEKYGSAVFEYTPAGWKELKSQLGDQRASLFLNGVGGAQFDHFLKLMKPSGSVAVCYGAQRGPGLFISGSNFIFPELTLHGFLLPKYLASLSYAERQNTLLRVLEALFSCDFSYPSTTVSSLEALPDVWDETFLEGGKKGIVSSTGAS